MIYEMYSIKDELSDYSAPIPFLNCDGAKRFFRTQLEENEFMRHNKQDFSLWYMGLFDNETGSITENLCKLIERGYQQNGGEEVALPDTD